MSKPSKTLAFLAYLLSILGWLYVLLFHRKDELAFYHARQSMMLTLLAIVTPAVWIVVGWALAWIPLVGPLTAASLFSLTIAIYIFLAVAWIVGMIYALQAKMKPLPIVGGWTERLLPEA